MNEAEKMKAGMWYDANNDPHLLEKRMRCKDLCLALNQTKCSDLARQQEILSKLLTRVPSNLVLLPPFQCDYGYNIEIKNDVFINHNCYFMDCATISIGHHVFIGPDCGLYTANHPLSYELRNQGLEQALPITIGDNCWLGAKVSIMPGVTIGEGSVIGAGSVVTHDIPPHTLAAGVPARVIKPINSDKDHVK